MLGFLIKCGYRCKISLQKSDLKKKSESTGKKKKKKIHGKYMAAVVASTLP